MSDTIIILTEEPLTATDARNISELYGPDDDVALLVLVPADTHRHLLVDVIDQLTMLDVPAALREFRDQPDAATVRATAVHALELSLTVLSGVVGAGTQVTGRVAEGDAVASLVAQVKDADARQAVVVTRPHAVADTFRRDWAHQAQRKLGLPVLHLYSDSGFIGDS